MTATTLQRLLKYPHRAVFEKDPGGELVLRLSNPDGCSWYVADGVMTVTLSSDEPISYEYDLSTLTVGQLVNALRADGFEVDHISAAFDDFSALVIVESTGESPLQSLDSLDFKGGAELVTTQQNLEDKTQLKAFTSLMWVLFTAYAREINDASAAVRQAILQMAIPTAEGEWLDLWGALHSVPRLDGELDPAYRVRIPKEAFRIRVNARAIELAIKDITGKDVQILEPWTTVFTLDQSALSGGDMLQDNERVGPFWIQPQSIGSIDWSDVLPVIERNRPEGVKVLPPQVRMRGLVVAEIDGTVRGLVRRLRAHRVPNEDLALLDYALIEDTSVLNLPSIHRETRRHSGHATISTMTWPSTIWQDETWDSIIYIVGSRRSRSYRVYRNLFTYESQPWMDAPWSAVLTPTDTTIIRSKRSRS